MSNILRQHNLITHSPDETIVLGAKLAKELKPGSIICLFGDLGAGKTTLVKGFAKGLRLKADDVHSPTFTLLNIYEGKGRRTLYHFDLYRLAESSEIELLGYEEFLYGQGLSVIEWPERLGQLMPKEYIRIELSHRAEFERGISIKEVK
ncbi:MAG: tRNA (adenosine(37)-N6)-threonylcarbamoyltransferase complex ATPase subunit type 1 TsaE [Candidatus Omnitrophica bacterium]|nr:tRNA (adenosine(37)-N6)-threonylcarbamoyltransferase complex ATPase subunit type 1 TsaE [Candidatus Omnitrophota bacterium]